MNLLQNIQELPKNEKLVIMEFFWKDLFEENDELESPEWHKDTEYMVTDDDANLCKLWIDIPPMRLDGTVQTGVPVNIEVQLLCDRANTGLCPACHPSSQPCQ